MARKRLRHDLLKCFCHNETGTQNGHDDRVNAQGRTGSLPAPSLEFHQLGWQRNSDLVGK